MVADKAFRQLEAVRSKLCIGNKDSKNGPDAEGRFTTAVAAAVKPPLGMLYLAVVQFRVRPFKQELWRLTHVLASQQLIVQRRHRSPEIILVLCTSSAERFVDIQWCFRKCRCRSPQEL